MIRIISLVPSQTELLYHLGLDEEVTGITKFCVHPQKWFREKTRIGGTKNINIEKIKSLHPDLVIANKEENVKEQVEALTNFTHVFTSDISTLNDALNMIISVGNLVNKEVRAKEIAEEINDKFSELEKSVPQKIPAAYLIWQKPYMAAGGETFINEMMHYCGFDNVFKKMYRYPEITVGEIMQSGCKLVLLSSEPYPFKQKHIEALKPMLPGKNIILVDGELFSWYGSRLLLSPEYFKMIMQTAC